MLIQREQEASLYERLNTATPPHSVIPRSVIIVEGARQVGKSTLVKTLLSRFQNTLSINLEEDLPLKRDIDRTTSFEEFKALLKTKGLDVNKKQILFIDEAQESNQLGKYVRFMKEKWQNTKSILSGSSMQRLFQKDQRIPVGRIERIRIQPLTLWELLKTERFVGFNDYIERFLSTENITPLMHEKMLEVCSIYLQIGGLPEVVTTYLKRDDYKYIRSSILIEQEEDFLRVTDSTSTYEFTMALKGVANNLGFPSKYTHFSNSSRKGKEIIHKIQDWHLVHEIEQKGNNSTSAISPKRYCYDLGIAQDLRNIPFSDLSLLETKDPVLRTSLGGLIENMTLLNLTSSLPNNRAISGWHEKSSNKSEVDFILDFEGTKVPIEVKARSRVTPRSYNNIVKYLDRSKGEVGFLVSTAPYEVIEKSGKRLVNLPIYLAKKEIIMSHL